RPAQLGAAAHLDEASGGKLSEIGTLGKAHIVRPAVDAIDHEIPPLAQLIHKAFAGDAAKDLLRRARVIEYPKFAALPPHRPLHGPDDVAVLAAGAQDGFVAGAELVSERLELRRQSHLGEPIESPEQETAAQACGGSRGITRY